MVSNNIEALLEKYEHGETNLEEEAKLKAYFSQKQVAAHLKIHQPIFQCFLEQEEIGFAKPLEFPKKTLVPYKWLSIAAVIAVAFGFYFANNTANSCHENMVGTYCKPEDALEEVSKSLTMISNHFNKGITTLKYLDEMENSTRIIFKTTP